MGHSLDAFILRASFDRTRARDFDMRYAPLRFDLTIFFVVDSYIDAWSQRLGMPGARAAPRCNFDVIHHMMSAIAADPLYAVISSDYFGGAGSQSAAVYRGEGIVLEPTAREGSINDALRLLGVKREGGADEFDTMGLGAFRNTRDHFGEGYDDL